METQGKRIIDDLLYPELCYKIVGVLFDVYKQDFNKPCGFIVFVCGSIFD
jgi:hypothetical protein